MFQNNVFNILTKFLTKTSPKISKNSFFDFSFLEILKTVLIILLSKKSENEKSKKLFFEILGDVFVKNFVRILKTR